MSRDAPSEQRNNAYEYERPERRAVVYVKDKPAERGVLVNNVISAMLLAVMGWVGFNVDALKTTSTVNTSEIKHLTEKVNALENEVDEWECR